MWFVTAIAGPYCAAPAVLPLPLALLHICRQPCLPSCCTAAPPAHACCLIASTLARTLPPEYGGRPLRFFSANNALKSYYLPLLLRPLSFLR